MTKGIILKEMDNIEVVYCKHCKKTIIYKKEKPNKFIDCDNCDYLLELKPLHSKMTFWVHSIIWGIIGLITWINTYIEDPSILDDGSIITILTIITFGLVMGVCTYIIQRFMTFCKYFKIKHSIKSINNQLILVNDSLNSFNSMKTQYDLIVDELLNFHNKLNNSIISWSSDLLSPKSNDNNTLSIQKDIDSKSIEKQDDVTDENKSNNELNIIEKIDNIDNIEKTIYTEKIVFNEKDLKIETISQAVNKILQNLYIYVYDNDTSRKMIQNFLLKTVFQNATYSMISVISLQYEIKKTLWIKDNDIDNYPIIKDSLEYVSDRTMSDYVDFYEIFMEEFGPKLQTIIAQIPIKASDFHFKDEEKFNSNLMEYPISELFLTESVEIMANVFKQRFPSVVASNASNKGMLKILVKTSFFENSSIIDDGTLDLYFCYLMELNIDEHGYDNQIIINKYSEFLENIHSEIDLIKSKLRKEKLKSDLLSDNLVLNPYTIDDIDNMSGREFEKYLFQLFEQMGYICTLTSESNDQGLDLIVEKYGKKIGIQAKCYKNKVGNTAVQEVLSGVQYYNCDEGMVITNSLFTSSADDLATKTGIVLWNRAKLMVIMSQYPVNKV